MKIFTYTQGRTGTAFLAKLFAKNTDFVCAHEHLRPEDYGTMTPDIQVMRCYNSYGNIACVKDFWHRKAAAIKAKDYIETAHMNAKAGLIENQELFDNVKVIHLKREAEKIIRSMVMRNDYISFGNHWLWYLDHTYPLNIVQTDNFKELGRTAGIAWYWTEMEARAKRDKNRCNMVDAHLNDLTSFNGAKKFFKEIGLDMDPVIPGKQNAGYSYNLTDELEDEIKRAAFIAENTLSEISIP